MSRTGPGAVRGMVGADPARCRCGHLDALHVMGMRGRGACSAWDCDCARLTEVDTPLISDVERLTARLATAEGVCERLTARLHEVCAERDAARAEVERLRKEMER